MNEQGLPRRNECMRKQRDRPGVQFGVTNPLAVESQNNMNKYGNRSNVQCQARFRTQGQRVSRLHTGK